MTDIYQRNNLFAVDGLVAVITGGATGIGLMMTKALASNGAKKIYIVGRRKDKLEEAASHNPSVIIPVVGDVTSKDTLKEIAARVEAEVGYINLLICNSGAMGPAIGLNNRNVSIAEYATAAMQSSPWMEWSGVGVRSTPLQWALAWSGLQWTPKLESTGVQ